MYNCKKQKEKQNFEKVQTYDVHKKCAEMEESMKNKVIGIVVFLFFMAVPFLIEGGNITRMLIPSSALVVFGPAAGLSVAFYRKGMDRQKVLKKVKQYLIISGIIGTLLGLSSILFVDSQNAINTAEILRKSSFTLIPVLYGLISGYIVDTFIEIKE